MRKKSAPIRFAFHKKHKKFKKSKPKQKGYFYDFSHSGHEPLESLPASFSTTVLGQNYYKPTHHGTTTTVDYYPEKPKSPPAEYPAEGSDDYSTYNDRNRPYHWTTIQNFLDEHPELQTSDTPTLNDHFDTPTFKDRFKHMPKAPAVVNPPSLEDMQHQHPDEKPYIKKFKKNLGYPTMAGPITEGDGSHNKLIRPPTMRPVSVTVSYDTYSAPTTVNGQPQTHTSQGVEKPKPTRDPVEEAAYQLYLKEKEVIYANTPQSKNLLNGLID